MWIQIYQQFGSGRIFLLKHLCHFFFNLTRKLSKSKKPLHMLVVKMWYFATRIA